MPRDDTAFISVIDQPTINCPLSLSALHGGPVEVSWLPSYEGAQQRAHVSRVCGCSSCLTSSCLGEHGTCFLCC
jgi:hypothetical protein